MKISGWGRYPLVETHLVSPHTEQDLRDHIAKGCIARGNGRAYGDSAVSTATTLHMRRFNRMLGFDAHTGILEAEAGVLLEDIIKVFLPQGWFPWVTPGTKFVTLGGMIAADVHGKNHHINGGMSGTLTWIDVMTADGSIQRLNPDDPYFALTCGGMGLTGIILRAAIKLRRVETGYIEQRTLPAPNLKVALEMLNAAQGATYSVAWIDCLSKGAALGRALIMLGEHAKHSALHSALHSDPYALKPRRKWTMPMAAPQLLLNQYTARAFNAAYWRAGQRKTEPALTDWDRYFYPLDAILGWNRIYGRHGFLQFQCVLPHKTAEAGLEALLQATSDAGLGAFLAVLKQMGSEAGGISFPSPGLTLAIDFPNNRNSLKLMKCLDQIVLAHEGRFYLAKDARLSAQTLNASDPRMAPFAQMRQITKAGDRFYSAQSRRLKL